MTTKRVSECLSVRVPQGTGGTLFSRGGWKAFHDEGVGRVKGNSGE